MHELLNSQMEKQKKLEERHKELMAQNENLVRQVQSLKNDAFKKQQAAPSKPVDVDDTAQSGKLSRDSGVRPSRRARQAMSQKDHDIQFRKRRKEDPNNVFNTLLAIFNVF